jgi:zinc protease
MTINIMNAPPCNSTEFVPYRMGLAAFGGALFASLRTQRNLSYSQGAYANPGQMPYGIMFVSTAQPKEAVQVMTDMLIKVKNYGLSPVGLQHLQGSFITNYYMSEQSSSAIAGSLGEAEILGGWYLAESLPGLVQKATPEQIKDAMNKYIVGLRWSYLGKSSLADDAADAFKVAVK